MSLIPATILTGFLGSGKTTLLKRVLSESHGQKIAVIENEFGEENIDNDILVADTNEQIIQMSNGCICCTLREDLLKEVSKLAREGRFDALLIESTGVSEPMPVAETFSFTDESGRSLGDLAQLDTMVTVVDARNFLNDYYGTEELRDRGRQVSEEDGRTIVHLLTDQIEFANVILINKTDAVNAEELQDIRGVIQALNPKATVHETRQSAVPLSAVLNTGLYEQAESEQAEGWLDSLKGHTPETEEYGISSFVFRARRPFHPQRLQELLNTTWEGVIRAKGMFWLATRMELAGFVSQAGVMRSTRAMGIFWSAVPEEEWPQDEESLAEIRANLHEPFGDRRSEIRVELGAPWQAVASATGQRVWRLPVGTALRLRLPPALHLFDATTGWRLPEPAFA